MFEGSDSTALPDVPSNARAAGHDLEPPPGRYGGIDPSRGPVHEVDWSYYPRAVYRRRWTAITVLFVAVLLGVMRNITAVPIYETHVRVLVEPEHLNLVKIDDPVSDRTSSDADVAILRSRWLLRKTLEGLKMWPADRAADQNPAAAVRMPPPTSRWSMWEGAWSQVTEAVSVALGMSTPPPSPRLGETAEQAGRIDALLAGLNVSLTTSGILDINYRSSDPVAAAEFANAHAEQYIAQNLERRFEAVREVTDWLAARLGEQRQKLDAAEQALAEFRDQNNLSADGSDSIALSRLNALSTDLTKARTTRLEKEAALNRALALRIDPVALDRLPPLAANSAIQQLRGEIERLQRDRAQLAQTLGERHPEMIKVYAATQAAQVRLDEERTRVLASMRDDLAGARTVESALAAQFESEKRRATAQNRKGVELSILVREAESNQQIYDMLVQRARETNIAKDINPSRIRILDPALVPQTPVSPNKRRDLLLALAMGLGLAIALSLGFEFLDSRIKSPDQLQSSLGLPFLGLIPELHLKPGATGHAVPLITNGVPAQFLEAIRALRTNIVFSFPEGLSRSMVVTSAGPGEGKTVVASNVAIGLGQLGERVLLIDADMRRPKVHEFFGVRAEPGLSNLLVGATKASDAVLRTTTPNVWVLPAGHKPPNPCDLLGSERFRSFLAAVRDHFDWVLIDAPPVLAVTDASVVGHTTSGVLFVVGAERVTRHAARRAIEQLESAHAKFAGAVLTRVELERHSYYYSHYYHPNYSNGYYLQQTSRPDKTAQAV